MLTERQFDAGAVALNYVEGPASAPPLLLIHGLSFRWQSWLPVMPLLALRWRLFAPDLRGFGRSGRVPGAYRVLDYAADITTFLRDVVGQPAVVVGHSLGAVVALAVAAETPERVRALVLEEPPLSLFTGQSMRDTPVYETYRRLRDLALRQPSLTDTVEAFSRALPEVDAVEARSRAVALLQRDPEVLTFVLEDRAGEGFDLEQRLPRITCPALLIQGSPERGSAFDDQHAEWLAARLRQSVRVAVPTAGHFIHRSQPGEVARLVAEFLESI
jgi:pimeloyl-ACP methyl ester carboxylesterase